MRQTQPSASVTTEMTIVTASDTCVAQAHQNGDGRSQFFKPHDRAVGWAGETTQQYLDRV